MIAASLVDEHDVDHLIKAIKELPTVDTRTLILRVATTLNPVTLWALHCELDDRDVAPCMRWPANEHSEQAEFTTFLADLLWLARRFPDQAPQYRIWKDLLGSEPDSFGWHQIALTAYRFIKPRYSVAHYCARGIGLADRQRQDLMVLVTGDTVKQRRKLHRDRQAEVYDQILMHAHEHQDRAGKHHPESVAIRRAAIWRTYVLAGMNKAATARHWAALTGEGLSRQAIDKQLDSVAAATCRGR